jgi:hypothetical protein
MKRFDDLMEAVTFAQAGEMDDAQRIARDVFPDGAAIRRLEQILAVSAGKRFSEEMIERSLGVAARLQYALVALSVLPGSAQHVARVGGRRRDGGIWVPAELFGARAAEQGVPFVHAVRGGDAEKAVADIQRRFRRVAFLLVESELTERARFSAVNVPIFTVN